MEEVHAISHTSLWLYTWLLPDVVQTRILRRRCSASARRARACCRRCAVPENQPLSLRPSTKTTAQQKAAMSAPPIPARELFIDGRWVAPSTGRYLDVVSPATEAVVGRIPAGGPSDVDAAVAAAAAAHKRGVWGKLTGAQRAVTLRAIAQKVRIRQGGRVALHWSRTAAVFGSSWTDTTNILTFSLLHPPRSATARPTSRAGRRSTWASRSTSPSGTWCAPCMRMRFCMRVVCAHAAAFHWSPLLSERHVAFSSCLSTQTVAPRAKQNKHKS